MTGFLLKMRSDPSLVLQFAEQALNDVALFIEIPVARTLLDRVGLGGKHRLNLACL